MEEGKFWEGDDNLYFSCVRAFRQPTSGSYNNGKPPVLVQGTYFQATNFYITSQELRLALGTAGPEEKGYSKSISVDPYWANLHIKYLWEDFNSMTEDRRNLKKVVANRKKKEEIITDTHGYNQISYVDSKPVLCEHVENLELIHKSLEEHIENELEKWANENGFPDPQILPRKYNLKNQYVPTFDELWTNKNPLTFLHS
jgi:hypothetical protein